MKEYDEVKLIAEKEKYAREGVHKGAQGTICDPRNIYGQWLVDFRKAFCLAGFFVCKRANFGLGDTGARRDKRAQDKNIGRRKSFAEWSRRLLTNWRRLRRDLCTRILIF